MIAERLHQVEAEISAAMARRTRVPKNAPVKLVAVTKNHDVAAMREAIDAGVTDIGENRIQEAKSKFDVLERDVMWHLIGHLQTNKARQAVKYFSLIHSVDSEHLARALDHEAGKLGKLQDVLVQVNLAKEASKSGVYKEDLRPLLDLVDELPNLRLRGLMCIAPNYENVEDCRPLFHEMYEIFQQVKEIPFKTANISYLSMGMTHDYTIAVEEGANIVRVGTAIFGPRQY
ncbi:YggS family pyridoxal phosphate-dependent enzyme [Mitsuokella sp. AF33-22]|uniref:YggS family pyridoxal phosphate-dependent enzyme n=1 Tax=Mitsuokella sp. AF33-22 TaxID=2292047 RepID=UPI000E4B1659|nr:YggS family pyridoxal phosphate-dependent enzyme [Mitsuokella sp. AF33-22]RHM56807.1 YggS family pyridoxal phosphate-dependent enzyme [Mitsuokella sp. AF33-22]